MTNINENEDTAFDIIWAVVQLLFNVFFVDIPLCIYHYWTKKPKNVHGDLVVITGGAQGLGKQIAKRFAFKHGAKIVLLDINESVNNATVAGLRKAGADAYGFTVDVSDEQQMRNVATKIYQHPDLGEPDIVVCNAAILDCQCITDFQDWDVRRSMDVNLMGCFWTIRAFLPTMLHNNRGHIVTICSVMGMTGDSYASLYCGSKFGVRGMMESLKWELRDLGKDGVHTTTVFPFFIHTTMTENALYNPSCFSVLEADDVAQEIVDATLRNHTELHIPGYFFTIETIAGLLPDRIVARARAVTQLGFQPKPRSVNNNVKQ